MPQLNQDTQTPSVITELCAIDLSNIDKPQRISPKGAVIGRDGRTYIIDANKVIDNFNRDALQVPLTASHEWSGRACGWFTEYNEQEDGIYATLRTNKYGQELLDDEQFKYLSPEYQLNYDTREVSRIAAISLVNSPNVLDTALNRTQTNEQEAIVPKPNTPNEITELNELQAQLDQLTASNQTLTEANGTLQAQAKAHQVDSAISQGKLAPAKRDFALTLEVNALVTYLDVEASTFKVTENNNLNPDAPNDDSSCAIADLYNGTGE